MSIGIGAAEAWRVEVVPEQDFLSLKLDPADVLVLANVAALSSEQAERLAHLVRGGMGLLIFTGGKLDICLYNDLLYRTIKLLPYPLKTLVDETFQGVIVEPVRPSPIEALLELKPTALERVSVRQIMAVDENNDREGVHVLARWNDPARSPARSSNASSETAGSCCGRTTADRTGNDWPVEPASFVLALRRGGGGTARPGLRFDATINAGERMRRVVRSSQQIADAKLIPPGGGEPKALRVVPLGETPDAQGPAYAIDVPDTRQPGLYRLTWDEGPLGTQQDLYAANPDPRESSLPRIKGADLKTLLKPLDVEIAVARSDQAKMFGAAGREVWHEMAFGLFVLLVIESIFATWVGRSPCQ